MWISCSRQAEAMSARDNLHGLSHPPRPSNSGKIPWRYAVLQTNIYLYGLTFPLLSREFLFNFLREGSSRILPGAYCSKMTKVLSVLQIRNDLLLILILLFRSFRIKIRIRF